LWPGGVGDDPANPPVTDVLPSGSGALIAGVPEPADWIIVLFGTFALGWMLRRRQAMVARWQ
jgi:hypothetical protein